MRNDCRHHHHHHGHHHEGHHGHHGGCESGRREEYGCPRCGCCCPCPRCQGGERSWRGHGEGHGGPYGGHGGPYGGRGGRGRRGRGPGGPGFDEKRLVDKIVELVTENVRREMHRMMEEVERRGDDEGSEEPPPPPPCPECGR